MADALPVLRLERGKHRIFSSVLDMVAVDAFAMQAILRLVFNKHEPDVGRVILGCAAAKINAHIIVDGYVAAYRDDNLPNHIDIGLENYGTDDKSPLPNRQYTKQTNRITDKTKQYIFAAFVEQSCDWFKINGSTDYHKWPHTLNFCRVVRNAISHGEVITINSDASPKVSWMDITIDHKSNGQPLFKPDIFEISDLMMLLVSLDRELTALNAPLEL